jgi:hypothetical protein
VPGSLDFTGMLTALEGRTRPSSRHPLADLAEAAEIARARLTVFEPDAPALPPQPVDPRGRRFGS